MSRMLRAAVLACALLSSLAVTATSAPAVTWHNTGDTAFTATGGAMTFSGGATSLNCTNSSSTGTAPATFVGDPYPFTLTTVWHCMLAGVPSTVECHETVLGGGITPQTCTVAQGGTEICHLHGFQVVHYIKSPGTAGRFTWTTTNAWTRTSGSLICPDKWHVPHLFQVVTGGSGGPAPHTGPVLTRTP